MRWTKNDSLAFDATMKAGQMIRDAYDNYEAGEAYKAGAGLGASTPEEYRRYADTYAESNPEAAAAFRQAAEANYTAPTAQERRRQGIGAQADWYAGRGDIVKSNALYDQADQMELRGMQRDKLKRDEKREIDRDAAAKLFQKRVADPKAYLTEMFNSDKYGDMPGVQVKTVDTNGGTMAFLVDKDGNPVMRDGSPVARHLTNDQIYNQAFEAFLANTDPKEFGNFRRGLAKDKVEADRWDRTFTHQGKVLEETTRHNKAVEGITRERIGQAGASGKGWQITSSNEDGSLTYARTNPKTGELEFKVARPLGEDGKPIDPKYIKGLGPQKDPAPAKPMLTFDKYLESFPPKPGETEEAAVRRYQRFLGGGQPQTGQPQGGMAALAATAEQLSGNRPSRGVGPQVAPVSEPNVVSMEPAGSTMFGGKQFVVNYADGTRRLVSGDEAERMYILQR